MASRPLSFPVVALLAAGAWAPVVGAPSWGAPSGPVVVDVHASVEPPEVFAMSSSASGTLYGSDREGETHLYYRTAPLASGALDTGLGVNPLWGDWSIVGTKIAIPVSSSTRDRVVAVSWCSIGACGAPLATIGFALNEKYVANTGTGVLLYDTSGSRQLRIKPYAGGAAVTVGTLPVVPEFPEAIEGQADPTGAVLQVDGNALYDDFSSATVTPLTSGGEPLWANQVALSPHFLARQYFDGTSTVVSRLPRATLTGPLVTFTAAADTLQDLRITDTGTAWLVQDADGQILQSRPVGSAVTTQYVRHLTGKSLSSYEATNDFLLVDRTAPTPGFYRLSAGSSTGSFVGVLGPRYARTEGLAVSVGRVLYGDDSQPGHPIFLRDTTGLPTLAGEVTMSADSTLDNHAMDLSGAFIAFARVNVNDPTRLELVYGRPGSALSTVLFPSGEAIYRVDVSGRRAVVIGSRSNRLVDLMTGTVSTLAAQTYYRLWGDFLLTQGVNTALLQRRNLATGAIATISPADPACGANCVDDDSQWMEIWGNTVAYRFRGVGGVLHSGLWTATSPTSGTTRALPIPAANLHYFALSDGLLFTHETNDRQSLFDLRTGTSAVVDSSTPVGPADADGYRMAWLRFPDMRAYVADVRKYLPAYALTAPLLESALAPGGYATNATGTTRWQPRFFASRDVDWTLELRSTGGAGSLVRTFTDTSAFGEIAPSGGWDGTDGFGAPAPQGWYTWTLRGVADGLPLTTTDGAVSRTGSVYLSRTPLATPTVVAPAVSATSSTSTSFGISWRSAGAPAGTRYTVRTSINGGAFTTILSNTSATSVVVNAVAGQTRRFSVVATDPAGRLSAPGSATTVVPYDDIGAPATGTWLTTTASTRYRGSEHTSVTAGSTISFTATGTSISVVGDKGPANGQFQVSYDGGAYSTPIDSLASTALVRQVLTAHAFTGTAATHSVRIRVVGTVGRPAVSIDAFGFRN